MSTVSVQFDLREHMALRDRMRKVGILLVSCDAEGELRARPQRGGDWFADLCYYSPLFRSEIGRAVERWNAEEHPEPLATFPGMLLAPMAVDARRGRIGYTVAVILTDEFLEAEQLAGMCQGAKLDLQLVRTLVASLPLAAQCDVPRLVALVGHAHEDQRRIRTESSAMESIGSQLAESYEEIHLLYTIIGSMGVVERPERFVTVACEELLETVSYRWIGTVFREDHRLVDRISGWWHVVGDMGRPVEVVRERLLELMPRLRPQTPLVVEPGTNPEDAPYAELGRMLLAHPVTRDGEVLGMLVAGEKHGEDLEASSGDMKLLGATAGNMAIFLENAALYDDLNSMFLGTLVALTSAIDAKDPYTCGHSQRVALLTRQLAEAAGLDEQVCSRFRIAGLVHDVGKIGVPERVLTKPGRLNEEEFARIREHPEIGYRILKDIPQLRDILPGVLHHHERWDGAGYPEGLAGEEIPRIARIIALADSFDAMSSTRTYRAALSRDEVIAELLRNAGRQFDPALVPIFVGLDFSEFDLLVADHPARDARVRNREDAA